MNKTNDSSDQLAPAGRAVRWLLPLIAVAASLLIVLAVLAVNLFNPAGKIGSEYHDQYLPEELDPDIPAFLPPIMQPETFSIEDAIEEAGLKDDDIMVAVQVGDQHRAYLLSDFFQTGSHVVNDLIDGVPVSITYCNQTDCLRVFTDAQSDQPLDLFTAAWMNDKMMLGVGVKETIYEHDDPKIPYADYKSQRIAFEKWCELHPEGRVYVGNVAWEMPEDLAP